MPHEKPHWRHAIGTAHWTVMGAALFEGDFILFDLLTFPSERISPGLYYPSQIAASAVFFFLAVTVVAEARLGWHLWKNHLPSHGACWWSLGVYSLSVLLAAWLYTRGQDARIHHAGLSLLPVVLGSVSFLAGLLAAVDGLLRKKYAHASFIRPRMFPAAENAPPDAPLPVWQDWPMLHVLSWSIMAAAILYLEICHIFPAK